MKPLTILELGRQPYLETWKLQRELVEKRQKGAITDTLIFVEHPPVITLGNRTDKSHLLASPEALQAAGIEVVQTDRGGDITYHGEGQLVGYTIVDVKTGHLGIRNFVCGLENLLIRLLEQEFSLPARRISGLPGVWVGEEKIAAMGLAVKRGVTLHGFALNVTTNLSHFDYIVPCGIRSKGVTSVRHLTGKTPSLEQVQSLIIKYFAAEFQYGQVKQENGTKAGLAQN